MKSVKPNISILIIALTALLVAACGGGGGGSSDATPTGVSITPTNAEAITVEVFNSVDSVQGMTESIAVLTGVSINVPDSNFNYPDLVVRVLGQLPDLTGQSITASVTGIAIPPEVVLCTDGGSYTISGDVSDPYVLTVGDLITATFNNCNESGIIINGGMSITITEFSGTFDLTPPYTLGVRVILSSLSISDGSFVSMGDGDMTMLLSETLAGDIGMLLSGNSIEVTEGGVVESLKNYRYNVEFNEVSGDFSVNLQGTLASTVIGGSVSYTTPTSFTGNDSFADGNPTAGVLLITTSIDSSRARITALTDGINVMIEVDGDGDGLYETTIMTTWQALDSI